MNVCSSWTWTFRSVFKSGIFYFGQLSLSLWNIHPHLLSTYTAMQFSQHIQLNLCVKTVCEMEHYWVLNVNCFLNGWNWVFFPFEKVFGMFSIKSQWDALMHDLWPDGNAFKWRRSKFRCIIKECSVQCKVHGERFICCTLTNISWESGCKIGHRLGTKHCREPIVEILHIWCIQ